MKPLRTALALTALSLAALGASQGTKYLNIGDPAPSLKVEKWIKGAPIPRFLPGKVYVVEFWATWCGPCKENIPHLTEMAAKFRGKAEIAGIDIWESTDRTSRAYLPKVAAFVAAQGAKMDYHVAVDSPKQPVADAWMKAAGEGGIPTSFVIGRDGKIAWIGHPAKLEQVLEDVVNDQFDVAAARRQRSNEIEVARPLQEAVNGRKYDDVIRLSQREIDKDPSTKPRYAYNLLVALFHRDLAAGKAEAASILAETQGEIGVYRMIGSIFASETDLSKDAYLCGRQVIEEALAKEQMKFMFLSMKAAVLDHLGETAEAISWQKQAISAAEADPYCTKEFVAFLRTNLDKMTAKSKG